MLTMATGQPPTNNLEFFSPNEAPALKMWIIMRSVIQTMIMYQRQMMRHQMRNLVLNFQKMKLVQYSDRTKQ